MKVMIVVILTRVLGNGLWSTPGDVELSLSKWFRGAADE